MERQASTSDRYLFQRGAFFAESRVKPLLVLVLIGLPIGWIYYLRLDDVIGQVRDDAWYVLLAKSLATGQGYQLISSPISDILPSYPPAFPFLLSLLFRLLPATAEHLFLLKWVSIAAAIMIGVVTYFYLARFSTLPTHLALAAATAVMFMPAFVFLATSTVMSECVFTLGQMVTVFIIERAVRQAVPNKGGRYWAGAGILAAFTFLTRSVAVTLVAAIVIYLLKEQQRKAALIFVGCFVVVIAPWLFYARLHAPTVEQKQMHGGYILYSYSEQLWMKRAGDTESGKETWRDLPNRVRKNIYNIVAHDLCGIVLPSALREPAESGEEVLGLGEIGGLRSPSMGQVGATQVISLVLAALALVGLINVARQRISLAEILLVCSLSLIVIWPWLTFRFLLPLAPFLLHYILQGLATLSRWMKSAKAFTDEWALPRVFMLCVLALYGYDHWGYLKQIRQAPETIPWRAEFNEVKATLDWARDHLPPDAIVAANNPPQFFLYTGRKAVTSSDPQENWERWRKLGVRYVVILSSHASIILDDEQQNFPIIYGASPEQMRIIDLGPPASRPPLK